MDFIEILGNGFSSSISKRYFPLRDSLGQLGMLRCEEFVDQIVILLGELFFFTLDDQPSFSGGSSSHLVLFKFLIEVRLTTSLHFFILRGESCVSWDSNWFHCLRYFSTKRHSIF